MPLVDDSSPFLTDPASAGAVRGLAEREATSVVDLIRRHAERAPGRVAFHTADGAISYGAFAARTAHYGRALAAQGVGAGDRVVVLLPISVDLYALAVAVLACGATLVVVDGRLSRRRLLPALADAQPQAVVAPSALLRWWPLVPALHRVRRLAVGGRAVGCASLHAADGAADDSFAVVAVRAEHPALVSFTSGTTGARAKAIVRTHGVLLAQHEALAAAFPRGEGDVNLTAFPMAVLHNLCCGATTVVPPAATARDGVAVETQVESALELVRRHGVTSLSVAPALLNAMAATVLRSRHPTPTLRRIVVGGGPVTSALCERVLRAFPHAKAEIVYGATEAEPIATISMSEAHVARGRGYVVGRPVASIEVVIAGSESACSTVGAAEVGEVLVRGRHVIGSGNEWLRTGDVGTIDGRGRLWLLGRLGWSVRHRGVELHPYVVEAELHRIAGVRAAALVAHAGAPRGEVAVCLEESAEPVAIECAVRARLESLGAASLAVRICTEIPMDARHASKVAREVLARRLARGGR